MTHPVPRSEDFADAPWYVRVAVRVGLPTVASAFLLWFVISNVTVALNKLADHDETIILNQQTIQANQREIVTLLHDESIGIGQAHRYLVCMVTTAPSTAARADCARLVMSLSGGERAPPSPAR